MKTKEEQVTERIEHLFKEMKDQAKEMDSLSKKLSQLEASSILEDVKEINGVKVLAKQVDVSDMNQLRQMVDDMKQKLKSAIILLATVQNNKVQLAAGGVTKDLVQQYHAGNLIKETAKICGGGGGGRPDMAQAGGKDPSKIQEALQYVEKYAEKKG